VCGNVTRVGHVSRGWWPLRCYRVSSTSGFQPSPSTQLAVGGSLIAVAALFVWLGVEALQESGALLTLLGIVTIACAIPSLLGGMLILSFGLLDSYRSLRGG
jgi:hypothetical protein